MDLHPTAWETFHGKNVRLTVCHGSRSHVNAPRLLQDSERVIDCLTTLLKPDAPRDHMSLHILLADPTDLLAEELPVEFDQTTGTGEFCRIVCVASNDEPFGVPIEPAVSELLNHWFGRTVSKSQSLVAGISGYVSACAMVGPPLAEADRWVKSELDSGRFVTILNCVSDSMASKSVARPSWSNAACTSFVGYVIENNGPLALRQYFKYWALRRAMGLRCAAFKQPLAVLEESWLASLRRKSIHGNELRSLLRRMLPLLSEFRWRQFEVLLLTLAAAAYNMVWPIATQRFIRMLAGHLKASTHAVGGSTAIPAYSAGGHEFFIHHVAPFLAVLLVLYVLDAIVTMRRTYAASWINVQVLNKLRERMYSHILDLSHDFYSTAKCADLMARLTDDIQNVQQALQQVTNKSFYQIFTLIGGIITLTFLNASQWQLTASVLVIVPVFAIVYATLKTRNKSASRDQRKRVSQTATATQESLLAHSTVKAFAMQKAALDQYRHRLDAQGKSALRLAILSSLSDLSEDMVTALAQLIIFGVGGYLLLVSPSPGPDHGLGNLAAALLLVKVIFGPITSLSGVGQTMQQAAGAMERVSDLFDEPVAVADKPDAIELTPLTGEIRFSEVNFGYGSPRSILRGLNLSIPAGANVAIVGATGSGKTTIINNPSYAILGRWSQERPHRRSRYSRCHRFVTPQPDRDSISGYFHLRHDCDGKY